MAEHSSDREDREEREEREGWENRADRADRGDRADDASGEQQVPFDEAAAWAAIVAGYGDEPPDPPGAKPFKSVEDLALLEPETNDSGTVSDRSAEKEPERETERETPTPLGSSVTFAPGVAGGGPRDYSVVQPSEDDFAEDDEGHFVPPEPPPLPTGDATARFAWLGVLGGPVLLLLAVLLGWEMTWWLTTLGIGGFLGGFTTLVTRMRTDDEEDDDPGRGAVV